MISAIIITKNEEENIEKCLSSISWVDEIIIVDSGSNDRTEEISRKYTNNFYFNEWIGFGPQKQFCLEKTTQRWVLSIDADEIVTKELKIEINNIISAPNSLDGYLIPRLSSYLGKNMKYCGWYPDYTLRLARRSKCNFTNDLVHERLEVKSDKVGKLNHHFLHSPYKNIHHQIDKIQQYSSSSAIQMSKKGKKIFWLTIFIKTTYSFVRSFVFQRGFIAGWRGLVLSITISINTFLKYVKLKELNIKDNK